MSDFAKKAREYLESLSDEEYDQFIDEVVHGLARAELDPELENMWIMGGVEDQ
jgi:hypothetical protein